MCPCAGINSSLAISKFKDLTDTLPPLDSGSSLGRFWSTGTPCLALKSARYCIYSLYESVFLYADSWILYFSLAALACASYGSFPDGSSFCHLSPTSFAI